MSVECYCGNSVQTAPVAQGNCSLICKGDKTQFCGAGGKLSLWTLSPTGDVPANIPATPSTGTGTGSGSTSSASAVPAASGIAYWGCYSDTTNPRALPADFNDDSTRNSVDFCAQRSTLR